MNASTLLNFVFFQCVWFAAVVGAGGYDTHYFLFASVAALVVHISRQPTARNDLMTGILALCIGYLTDLLWVVFDVLSYPRDQLVPYWIGVLWFGLGASLNHSFALFKAWGWKGAIVVGAFAPVTYLTGERFSAVSVLDLTNTAWISLSWFIIFIGLTAFSNWLPGGRVSKSNEPRKKSTRSGEIASPTNN
jgi:hypothetical protein